MTETRIFIHCHGQGAIGKPTALADAMAKADFLRSCQLTRRDDDDVVVMFMFVVVVIDGSCLL